MRQITWLNNGRSGTIEDGAGSRVRNSSTWEFATCAQEIRLSASLHVLSLQRATKRTNTV
jgi:hypothetical protein